MTIKPPARPERPFRFTRAQYYDMGARGYFDGKRVELIFGEVVEMSPIGWPHALGVGLVANAVVVVFATGYWLSTQLPLTVPGSQPGSEPQPDVAVIPGSPRDYADHPTHAALVVEVADTTLSNDTTIKAELCATAGIADYWVLDVTGSGCASSATRNHCPQVSARPHTGRTSLSRRRTAWHCWPRRPRPHS